MADATRTLASEADILSTVLDELNKRLPKAWYAQAESGARVGRFRGDAVVTLASPRSEKAALYAQVRRSVVTRDLDPLLNDIRIRMNESSLSDGPAPARPMIIARYLAPVLQAWLTERNVPYADATGNVRIALEEPALFVRDVGAQKDPWRGPGRPKGNLKGASAARVVRALADLQPPYTVPALMKLAGTPSGNTYRAIDFIEQEDLLVREGGKIIDVRWRALLERWSKDYGFAQLAAGSTYLAPRGLPDLMKRLSGLDGDEEGARYAVTGSLATPKWEAYAPAKNAMIYADKPDDLAARLGLRQVDAGANVLIAAASATAAFDRTQRLDGTAIVAPSQAAVDLLTAPGRGPEEGRALLDWMEKNEPAWRQ